MTKFKTIAALALVLGAAPLAAHSFSVGAIKIGHPWTRETAPAQSTGGGFMTITNSGTAPDTLVSVSSPAAKEVQIHTMSMTGGVMRMRQLTGGLPIPAGGTVTLKPGAFHLMLIGLKAPLKQGTKIPAELRFQKAGRVRVEFAVQPIASQAPMEMNHAGH